MIDPPRAVDGWTGEDAAFVLMRRFVPAEVEELLGVLRLAGGCLVVCVQPLLTLFVAPLLEV